MKTMILSRSLAIAALGLLLAGPLRANDMHYDGMDEASMDRSFNGLDLSSEQKTKLRDARRENRDAMKSIWDRKEDHLKALKEEVDRKASDSEIEATLKELKDDKEAMESQRDKFHDKLEDILTPTQKAKWVLAVMGKMKRPTEMK
jgi:Spy/CpxP family protein refolding chaperone